MVETTPDDQAVDPALSWAEVSEALTGPRNYWVATTGVDGGPHAAPVWGVVVDGVWYGYGEPGTVRSRNLAHDPRVLVHLESGDDVLIVRGRMGPVDDADRLTPVEAAFAAKYTEADDVPYLPTVGAPDVVFYALEPTSALAWQLATIDVQRRWRGTG